MSLTYKKMSLFDTPTGSIITHAVNSQGIWSSGIAKEFKTRYPAAFNAYRNFVDNLNESKDESACGRGQVVLGNWEHNIGFLVTSHNYGKHKDPPGIIKSHTFSALFEFCENVSQLYPKSERFEIYSNKFNSGLFEVPWFYDTEEILEHVLKYFPQIEWIVCDPEMEE